MGSQNKMPPTNFHLRTFKNKKRLPVPLKITTIYIHRWKKKKSYELTKSKNIIIGSHDKQIKNVY